MRGSARSGPPSLSGIAAITAAHGIAVILLLAFGRLDAYLLYYLSLLSLYPLLNRVRLYGQHMALDATGRPYLTGSSTSRTTDGGWLDRLFCTSRVMMYHEGHHERPHLPWRALRKMAEEAPAQAQPRRWRTLLALYRALPA